MLIGTNFKRDSMIDIFYFKLFIGALCVKMAIEFYLERRNIKSIQRHRSKVPDLFKDKISLQDHELAAEYTLAKIETSQLFKLFDLSFYILLTVGGGLELFTRISMRYFETPIFSELLFFLLLGMFSFIIGLPESIYRTFFLEEKFGFNRTTIKTFILDILKGFILALTLGTPILYGVLKIMEHFSSSWWFFAFIFLSIVQFIIIFIYPRFIAPLFNKFTPLETGELKDSINALLSKINYSSNGIFIMDASKRSGHGNAYFTGLGKEKRIVFFDTLINTLNKNEIIAVLAHELGHMKLNHIIIGLFKSLIFSFISFYVIGLLKDNHQFLNGHGIFTITNANTLAILSMIAGVYTFWLTPIEAYLSRKNEYEADSFASTHANREDLISALIKMYSDNKSFLVPDKLYGQFYYSHPSAIERVRHLRSLDIVK